MNQYQNILQTEISSFKNTSINTTEKYSMKFLTFSKIKTQFQKKNLINCNSNKTIMLNDTTLD